MRQVLGITFHGGRPCYNTGERRREIIPFVALKHPARLSQERAGALKDLPQMRGRPGLTFCISRRILHFPANINTSEPRRECTTFARRNIRYDSARNKRYALRGSTQMR